MKREPLQYIRWGKKVRVQYCPNKKCKTNIKKDELGRPARFYGFQMNEIGSRDYENHCCHFCGCHKDGVRDGKLKSWTKEEWDIAIEKSWKKEL